MNEAPAPKNARGVSVNLRIDYRWVILALVAVIVAMLVVWKPWQSTKATDRNIEVTGEATVSARPDQFVFYPTYDFKNADKQKALDQLTAKSNEVVAALKKLGVADKDIKTNSDSWSYPIYMDSNDSTPTYTLRVTVTVHNETLAQKAQDYLVTTSPTGTISPQPGFSTDKQKELENKGRDLAAKEARAKAEQSGKNLGFKIAGVKSVKDGAGFGGIYPMAYDAASMKADASRQSLTIQPGENDITYSVTVTYFIR